MVTSITFYITYGKPISGMDDEAVITAQIASEGLSEGAMPGFSWLDYFPLARHIPSWVPGTYSIKLAEKYLPYVYAMRNEPYEAVKVALVCIYNLLSVYETDNWTISGQGHRATVPRGLFDRATQEI